MRVCVPVWACMCVCACLHHSTSSTHVHTVPTAPPQNFHVITINSTSLTFSWAPPPSSQQNGNIVGYSLQLLEVDTDERFNYTVTSRTVFTALSLHPYYSYVCTSAAYTEAGVGPYTEAITQRTLEDGEITCYVCCCLLLSCINIAL